LIFNTSLITAVDTSVDIRAKLPGLIITFPFNPKFSSVYPNLTLPLELRIKILETSTTKTLNDISGLRIEVLDPENKLIRWWNSTQNDYYKIKYPYTTKSKEEGGNLTTNGQNYLFLYYWGILEKTSNQQYICFIFRLLVTITI